MFIKGSMNDNAVNSEQIVNMEITSKDAKNPYRIIANLTNGKSVVIETDKNRQVIEDIMKSFINLINLSHRSFINPPEN